MKIYRKIGMEEFKPWAGAEETYKMIDDAGKMDELTQFFEEVFPDSVSETKINDILWFHGSEIMIILKMGTCCEECRDFVLIEDAEETEEGLMVCKHCMKKLEGKEEE